jgi:hypothetical protein
MKPKAWFLLSVAASVLAAGCYSSTIRAQAVPVDKPRQRIYVLVHEGSIESRHAATLARDLLVRLQHHLVSRGAVVTGVEFDKRALDTDIETFRPESVLEVKPIAVRPGDHGEIVYLSFGATLLDYPSNQTIWSAKAELSGSFGPLSAVAERIVGSLVANRMIPRGPPVKGPPPVTHRE